MEQGKSSRLMFVVGMHRSGTSAACAALNACGVSFGADLLEPMQGVNEAGFWEATEVVAINEELLNLAGHRWYSAHSELLAVDWLGEQFLPLRQRISSFLQALTAGAEIAAVKDPRLCLTLPLWLLCAQDTGARVSVCVVSRSPLAVAHSLQSRDAFPLGYGLRLLLIYLQALIAHLPEDTAYLSYEAMLADPVAGMEELADSLSLPLVVEQSRSAVLPSLQRQSNHEDTLSLQGWRGERAELQALQFHIEKTYGIDDTMVAAVESLVHRGHELQRIGDAHSCALQTIADKDGDIERIGLELRELHLHHAKVAADYTQALAEIARRDRWKRPFRALRSRLKRGQDTEHVENPYR